MQPQDIIWRLLDRLAEQKRIFEDSHAQLDPKENADLLHALFECEQLILNQRNILNRVRRRYE